MRQTLITAMLIGCGHPEAPSDSAIPATIAPTSTTDALAYMSRSEPTSNFWETTDVAAKGDVAYTCTGVQSLVTHSASAPLALTAIDTQIFPLSNLSFPRCTHVDVDGDRMVVSARIDEVQTEGWVSILDISKPRSPRQMAQIGFGAQPIEEATLVGDMVFVAATSAGVYAYDVATDDFVEAGTLGGLGTVTRVDRAPAGLAAGTSEGTLHLLGTDLTVQHSVELGAPIMGIQQIDDGRLAVALGSGGVALIDGNTGDLLGQVSTNGTALRLDLMDTGHLLVANWTDLRVYDVTGDTPVLRAVDAVFESEDKPRTFGVAAGGDIVYAGTWTGLHALRWNPDITGPEITPNSLEIGVADDGQPHDIAVNVQNEGQELLTVTEVVVPNAKWSAQPAAFDVEPGASQDVSLHYDGSDAVVLDTIKFKSNDADEPESSVVMRVGANAVFIGDPALDFTYTALNTGVAYTLSEQRGKVVVISYFATF